MRKMIKHLKKHWMLMVLIIYAIWRCGIPIYVDWDKFHEPGLKNFIGPENIYVDLARSMLERGEYNLGPGEHPYGIKTPGYSLIVAAAIALFGDSWAAALAIFQAVCLIVAAICIYIAGAGLRSPPVGAFAGFLAATYAPYHFISCILIREPVCLALFAMTMLFLLRRFYRKTSFIAMGFLIGVNAMVREEFLLLTLPCIVAIWLGEFGSWHELRDNYKEKWRKPLLKSLGVIAVILLVFSPWMIRNAATLGRLQMTGSLGGVQLFIGNNPAIRPTGYVYEYSFISKIPEFKDHSDYEVGKIYQRRALRFMLHNPDKVVVNAIGKVIIVFENSVANVNDFPAIFIGLLLGIIVGAHFKLSHYKIILISTITTVLTYIFWRGGISIGLLLPNIEFGWIFRILGLLGFVYLFWVGVEMPIVLVFPVMFMVNIVFIPQHRHRWITDWLFMLWIAIFLRDCALYLIKKQIDASFNTIRKQIV